LSKFIEQLPEDVPTLQIVNVPNRAQNGTTSVTVQVDRRTFQRSTCLEALVNELVADKVDDINFMETHREDLVDLIENTPTKDETVRQQVQYMMASGDFDPELRAAIKSLLREMINDFTNS
jgi:RNase adaptor protein for sRNA GlmZ degradation